jgi:hypothetical protein
MKYNKEISKLILKMKEKKDGQQDNVLVATNENLRGLKCPVCECGIDEHEKYIYCSVIGAYICDVCCRYELCNDYKLANKALGKEVFKDNNEMILLCQCCE